MRQIAPEAVETGNPGHREKRTCPLQANAGPGGCRIRWGSRAVRPCRPARPQTQRECDHAPLEQSPMSTLAGFPDATWGSQGIAAPFKRCGPGSRRGRPAQGLILRVQTGWCYAPRPAGPVAILEAITRTGRAAFARRIAVVPGLGAVSDPGRCPVGGERGGTGTCRGRGNERTEGGRASCPVAPAIRGAPVVVRGAGLAPHQRVVSRRIREKG